MIIGYRAWGLREDGSLLSISDKEAWVPGQNTAACFVERGGLSIRHPSECVVPHEGCACGLYAFRRREDLNWGTATGEVVLWGKVVHHADGYRAQYAEIRSVEIHRPDAERLIPLVASRYGVPVKFSTEVVVAPPVLSDFNRSLGFYDLNGHHIPVKVGKWPWWVNPDSGELEGPCASLVIFLCIFVALPLFVILLALFIRHFTR